MTTSSSSTFESIEKLLQFQNSFLNLVHSQVLSHQQGDKRKQALLKLQVLEISEKNEIFNEIITTLKRELIDEKAECDSVLKSYFLKLLELDYLPLLHMNRYELTKLSIFGFDIYIDPLQAILQVLNRLQRVLYILEDSLLKDGKLSQKISQLSRQKKSTSDILLCGWKEYYCFLQLHKLSLNIYMLKQYINIAITSLPKKDKEIIFTGVYNIYKRLIPILNQHYLVNILQQLSDLNNMMYNFHGSFDYFMFFTYLPPIEQNVGVYSRINEIQKKCSHTNILTPLLFGVMNNYKAFVKFISDVQSPKYVHLLRVLLSGLIINFKLRILEYNQVLQLIGLIINKLCLLNKMKLSIITGELAKQWKQAKQFFISAFKSGYNAGEIQTWTLCDSNVIQPTIITFLIKGLLLSESCRSDQFLKTLQKGELEQVLGSELKQLTDWTQTLNGLMNNWKQLTINIEAKQKCSSQQSKGQGQQQQQQGQQQQQQQQGQKVKEESLLKKQQQEQQKKSLTIKHRQQKLLNIVRVINLMSMLQLTSQRLVYAIVSALNGLKNTTNQTDIAHISNVNNNISNVNNNTSSDNSNTTMIQNNLINNRLSQSIQTLNETITSINRKQPLSNLKDLLLMFHLAYPPRRTFEDVIPVYLHSFITREALCNLVSLINCIGLQEEQRILRSKQVLTAVVHKYFAKCQHQYGNQQQQQKQQQQTLSIPPFEMYKSFDKQYKLPSFIFNIDPQPNSVFSNLVKLFTTTTSNEQPISSSNKQQQPSNNNPKQQVTNNNPKQQATAEILLNLFKHSPHHIIAVLNLPATHNQKITTFLDWLINSQSQTNHQFIIHALQLFNSFVYQNQNLYDLKTYLSQSYYLTVLDTLLFSISTSTQSQTWCQEQHTVKKVLNLISLFVRVYQIFIKNYDQNNQQPIFTLLSSVWINLSELLSYLLKNSHYSIQIIVNTCQLYWKILHVIKGGNINAWYHKLAINRIFSTLTTQNLLFSQSFKGITLISSMRNYHISKQNYTQNQINTNQNIKRHSFADIKAFFQNNYLSNSQTKTVSKSKQNNDQQSTQQKDQYLRQFLQLVKNSKNQTNPIKTEMHITNDKQMPPTLSEQKIQKLYNQYCNQKSPEQRESLQFCLLLLVLNPVNNRNLWQVIMKSQDKIFIQNMSFTRQTINEVLEVLQFLESKNNQKQKLQNQQKSSQNLFKTQITSMLGLQLLKNSVNELQLLSSAFYFNTSKLQTFLKHKQLLWFLIVLNNSSWREFNEFFSTHLKNTCFLSTLLQYKEYLSITHQASNDYQKKVEEFSLLIDQYLFYVQKKLNSIQLLKTIDSQKENQIRKSTLLINIKVLLLKCEMQKILQKVKIIVKVLHQNSLSDLKFKTFLTSLHNLNKVCNNLLGGNIELPDFVHHNSYTTAESEQKQFTLGVWIEECEKVFQHQEIQKTEFLYVPSSEIFSKKSKLEDFISEDKENDTVFTRVLENEVDKQTCLKEYEKLKQKLTDCLQSQCESVSFRHESCVESVPNLLNDFYCLGYLHFAVKNQQNIENNLSPLLESLVNRQRIPLEVIKQIDSSAYHHLKLLIINDKIQSQKTKSQQQSESNNKEVTSTTEEKQPQKITFVWNDKQLIPKGKQTIVNDQNKNLYIQLIAQQILGKPYIELNNAFALGYLNASFVYQHK